MKTLKLTMAVLLLMGLAACSSKSDSKETENEMSTTEELSSEAEESGTDGAISFDNDAIEKATSTILSDNDNDNDDDEVKSSASSTDWDSTLDSYEEYVDKYVALVKKAAKDDLSAMAEYPSMLNKAQEFSNKLEKAKGEMSSSQMSRYMKITSKMAAAMQELQKIKK